MIYYCNEEGVRLLRQMSSVIKTTVDEINGITDSVIAIANDNGDVLGPHIISLQEALDDIKLSIDESTSSVFNVAEKLNSVADKYQDIIDNDPFGGFPTGSMEQASTGAGFSGTSSSDSAQGGSVRAGNDTGDGDYGGNLASTNTLLGVSTNGSASQEYVATIHNRYENADPLARRVFDTYRDELCIRNANYPPNQTAHYSPMGYPGHPRGVYYNSGSDENNPRGNGATYFHELGHMIDHASTGYNGNTSHTDEFRNALIADGQNVLSLYNQLPADRQQSFLRRIYQGNAHSFSDLIDATTNGQLYGAYGHSRDYWTYDGNLQAEAFAHFFEASMGCEEKREFLSNFFPTAFGIFSGMLENIVANQRKLVLTRRLRK